MEFSTSTDLNFNVNQPYTELQHHQQCQSQPILRPPYKNVLTHKGDTNNHIDRLRTFKEFLFPCNLCKKWFKQKNSLTQHRRDVHNKKPLPFRCQECDEGFRKNSHLKQHQISAHDQKPPFNCKYCNKSFLRRKKLNRHQRNTHECTIWRKLAFNQIWLMKIRYNGVS